MIIGNYRIKWYLIVAGLFIVGISTLYSFYIASQLSEDERKKAELLSDSFKELSKGEQFFGVGVETPQADITFFLNIIESNKTIPILVVNDYGEIIDAKNYSRSDSAFLAKEYAAFLDEGFVPINTGVGQLLYYRPSTTLTLLKYFPFIQLSLISMFILLGYLAFAAARRAQENRIWVGMAKETAHQLGTPISALVGWIEHLKLIRDEDDEIMEITKELGMDVRRLELVADRFSKIGSEVELKPINVYKLLGSIKKYMKRRAPRKVAFDFPDVEMDERLTIGVDRHLFDWVLENLIRNGVDALEGKGKISARVNNDKDVVKIAISDTGMGIPTNKWKTIFEPGYTTKKRGWGLGLSLSKRIIEFQHKGKIYVESSTEGVGTTIIIEVPLLHDS